jgi:iron(III) transport system permease protein
LEEPGVGFKEACIQPRTVNTCALVVFGLIAIAPACHMLVRSVWQQGGMTLQPYLDVFGDVRQAGLLVRSLCIALGASLIATVLGVCQALLLVRVQLPIKRVWRRIYLLPLCIPPHVHAIALIYICGETGSLNRLLTQLFQTQTPVLNIYTPFWAAAVLAVAYHPFVTLMAYSGLLSADHRLEEAARQYHPGIRVLGRVTLPLLMPHIFSGTVFVFIFSFFNYGVPSLLRVHTYPVEIFAQFSAYYNEPAATALASPVIVVALVLLALQRLVMKERSYVVIDSSRRPSAAFHLGRVQPAATAFLTLIAGVGILSPLAVLAMNTQAIATFAVVWRNAGREIITTTVLSLTAATAMAVLAYVLGGLQRKQRGRRGLWLDLLLFTPLAIPATVLGIGLIYLWNRPLTQLIYGGAIILIIAYTARFIPLVLQAVIAGMRQVGPELLEAATLYQGKWRKRALKIDIPLSLPGLMAGWAIAFILCMGELGVTLLVIPPGMGTLSLKIYNLMHYGANQMVAALSIILIGLNLLVAASAVFFVGKIGRRGLG